MIQRLTTITIAILLALGISAANHFYDTNQLSSNLITSMCQDQKGYVWATTEYGLNRFDGVHFMQYYSDDDVAQPILLNHLRKVICDHNGNVWIVSYKGVQRYDPLTNSFPVLQFDRDQYSYPADLLERKDGKLVMLTIKNGLFLVDDKTMTVEPWEAANKLFKEDAASDMFIDSKNRIWICSDKQGVILLDVKAGKSIRFDRSQLYSNGANAVTEDGKGRIVVLSRAKVLLFDEASETLQILDHANGLPLRKLFRTKKGEVLLGTFGKGIYQVDIDQRHLTPIFQQSVDGISLASQSVLAFLEDAQNNVWLGCFQSGIAFLTSQQPPFSFFSMRQLPNDNGGILSLLAYQDGRFYVGQENNGISECTADGQVLAHRFPGLYAIAYQQLASGDEWIGTHGSGIKIFRKGSATPISIDSLSGKRVKDIAVDEAGNIYLAVFDNGLIVYQSDGTPAPQVTAKLKLHNRYPNKLFIDSKGWLWIGHYNGVDVFDTRRQEMVDIPVDSILRPSHTFAITESHDGIIWVGSSAGLFCYDRKTGNWKHYSKRDGLCNEIICGIVEDDKGNLWLSTYHGLSRLDRQKDIFINYYNGNGLQSSNYARGIYGKHDGMIYFGNDRGITVFPSSQAFNVAFEQGITLTGLFVANKEIGTDGEHIVLDYKDNTFTLQFATMDYREMGSVQYEYRFSDEREGVWHQLPPGSSDMILSNLRYGNHTLLVRALDNGVYSPVKQLSIRITPPWYRSWWAYTLYSLLAAAIIAFILLYYRQRQKADMNEDKIKFFVDISHELRSPLTLIKSPLEKLLKTNHDPNVTRALRNMENNTNRLLNLVNQILSIRKIEKGQMRLHFAETPLADFVENICHDYDYLVEKRNITLTFNNEVGEAKAWIDCDNFDKVVANLINNAIKYVDDGGHVEVTLKTIADQQLQLLVRDDGPGIDEAQLKKIFDRFYQASARPASGQMSYGIGLNLAQKLAMLHGGSITARNRNDRQGAEFVISMPQGNSHLQKSQLVDNNYFDKKEQTETKAPLTTDADKPRRVRKKTTYRIAVVDDDQEIRDFLQTELSESYHVKTYPDGSKAMEGITDEVPDLVISDVVMPQVDGIELLKRLKSNTKTSHIPVILLTTKTEHAARIEGLTEGADAYVDKPFNLEELESRIAGLIANRIKMRSKFSGVQEQEDTVKKIELKGNDAELMERIMKAINENLDDSDFNVEALADKVGLSRVQLHRRMKELTGITVGEFIRNLRLQQAAKLLEAGDINVSQVTYAVGFANPNNFTAAFKKHFGVTPTAYIAKHQAKKDDTKQNQ